MFPKWVATDDEGHLCISKRGLTAIVVEASDLGFLLGAWRLCGPLAD